MKHLKYIDTNKTNINKIHLLIGNKEIEKVYNPTTNRWKSLPKMNTPR